MECLGRYTFFVMTSVILSGGVKMRVEHGMLGEVYIFVMTSVILIAVGYVIYWIFMYDRWYPNDGKEHGDQDSSLGSKGGTHDGSYEGAHS